MTKAEMVTMLVEQGTAKSKKEAIGMIDGFCGLIEKCLVAGEEVPLSIGKFCIKRRDARKGRNPKTGESIMIDAKNTVTFRPSGSLKAAVQ